MVDRLNPSTTEGTFKYMMYYECADVKARLEGGATLLHFAVTTFEDPVMIKLVVEVRACFLLAACICRVLGSQTHVFLSGAELSRQPERPRRPRTHAASLREHLFAASGCKVLAVRGRRSDQARQLGKDAR